MGDLGNRLAFLGYILRKDVPKNARPVKKCASLGERGGRRRECMPYLPNVRFTDLPKSKENDLAGWNYFCNRLMIFTCSEKDTVDSSELSKDLSLEQHHGGHRGKLS